MNKILTIIGILCLGQILPATGFCTETNISAAVYLERQPKPIFEPGSRLPKLTRWGWTIPFDTRVELARNWGYALEFGGYSQLGQLEKAFEKSNSVQSRICNLAASDPQQYSLEVIMDLYLPEPEPVPDDFWVRDEQGDFTDGRNTWLDPTNTNYRKVISPEGPDDYWRKIADVWTAPLELIHQHAPIAIVLNGGETGVGYAGQGERAWSRDPRVIAAIGNRSWFEYSSERKAHYEDIVAKAVREAVPDRELYIYYNTGGESHRLINSRWVKWAYDSSIIRNLSDLPSFECYYRHYNTGWTGNNDLLTEVLDSVGYNEALGAPLSYNWLSGGWTQGGKDDISDIAHYMGFLKCLYTAGMIGGNAGYYANPKGEFTDSFPPDQPPPWLVQAIALSQVDALFTHLEPFLFEGYLLPGPLRHKWAIDQPAYEFPTGDADVRVLARKLRIGNDWLITSWAAGGYDRDVIVTIPELGQLTLHARACGAVYYVTKSGGKIETTLLDINGILPTENLPDIKLGQDHS